MTAKSWPGIRYFEDREFASPDEPGSGKKMDPGFVLKLDVLRNEVGFPLIVNSGYRTEVHNLKVGGVDSSSHTQGHAADIRATTSQERFAILEHAVKLGFRRIGIAKTYIHLDDDPELPQGVSWLY